MLDECKGERLEEVLAVFSSAVLKKLVAERALNSGLNYRPTISESISLENWGFTGDRTRLNGLLLAHKVSLRSMLEKKSAARQKYHDFAELLAMKERGISRRRDQAKHTAQETSTGISETEKAEVRRVLRNNWTGNEQWVDGLLGSSSSQKRSLFNTPFDDVWVGVQAGSITDLEVQATGLLEQLEERVDRQKSRLQKWENFRKNNFGQIRPKVARNSPPRESQNENSFDFTAHLDLKFDDLRGANNTGFDNPPAEYAHMLNKLTTELQEFKSTRIPDFSSLINDSRRGPNRTASAKFIPPEPTEDPVSDLSDWEDEPEELVARPQVAESSTNSNSRPTAIPRGFQGIRRQLPVPRESCKANPSEHEYAAEIPKEHRRSRIGPYPFQEQKPNALEDEQYKLNNEESLAPPLLNLSLIHI